MAKYNSTSCLSLPTLSLTNMFVLFSQQPLLHELVTSHSSETFLSAHNMPGNFSGIIYTYISFTSWKAQALRRQLYNCSIAGTHTLDDYLAHLKSKRARIFNRPSLTLLRYDISIYFMTEIRGNPKVCI